MYADTNSSNGDSIPDVVGHSETGIHRVRRSLQNDDGPYKRLSTSLKIDSTSDFGYGHADDEARGLTRSESDIESNKIHQNYLVSLRF